MCLRNIDDQRRIVRDTRKPKPQTLLGLTTICIVVSVSTILPADDHNSSVYHETPVTEDDRLHWSFQPIQQIAPAIANTDWRRNEIDDLIASKLSVEGIMPQPEASRRVLLRRLSFDLTGLPPSTEELLAFLSNKADNAFEQEVSRLLNSKRYGERWAQHWLDLARFAETDGFEHDKVRPDAWKYRDWVIGAFNSNMPYDDFVRMQIAGDEIEPDNPSAHTATQFCLSGPDMPDINLADERRHTLLNEMASTVGEVFLGLQIGCAQCHDHKYDPISQADFYRLRAIFEPAVQLRKNVSVSTLKETFPYARETRLMLRGDFRRPGPKLSAGVPRVVSRGQSSFQPLSKKTTAGLRTAFTDWMVATDNPLTARVIVNRVWQHHFGTGIVDTPSEFGLMGSGPRNEFLLDYLANYLITNRWNLKKLHRHIVTSATWRQRSLLPPDATQSEKNNWQTALTNDPNATLMSRYPRWRLEGEAIRDAMLFAAGRLNFRRGGPGVRPPLPTELVSTLLKNQWNVTRDQDEHSRRSIYVFARRNLRYPIFEAFDRPSANTSCSARGFSTTAPQSLHLLNSRFSIETAQHLARLIENSTTDHRQKILMAFQRTLSRNPSPNESRYVGRFMKTQEMSASSDVEALTHLCLSLFNSNEFVFVD